MPVQGGEGIGQFFRSLAMGPAMRQQAERKGRLSAYEEMLREAQAQGERQRAIRDYGENQGLSRLGESLAPLLGPELARAAQDSAYGKYDLRQATGAGGDLQKQLMARDARDALAAGDFERANASLAAIDGKPLAITDEQGGVLLNPYDSVGDQTVRATPVGQAEIGLRGAQAAQARAAAAENAAQAGLANARTANVRSGGENVSGSGGRGGRGGSFNIESGLLGLLDVPMTDVRGKPVIDPKTGVQQRGSDPAEVARFFRFAQERANRGGGTNLDGALMDYLQGRELKPEPRIIDPTEWQRAPEGAPEGGMIRDKRDGRLYRVIRGYLAPEN